jgi:branched-chain amino acid transport system ATP-binding protein
MVAAARPGARAVPERAAGRRGDADDVLDLVGMAWAADAMPDQLSEGQRKLVGVARALAGSHRLLCLDEPAAGLDFQESEDLGRCLRALADRGQSTLLIDHDMGLVLGICDRVIVLEFGRVIADDGPEAVRRDPQVIAGYLGGSDRLVRTTDSAATGHGERPVRHRGSGETRKGDRRAHG